MTITPQPLTEQQVARPKHLRNRTTRRETAINGERRNLVRHPRPGRWRLFEASRSFARLV